MRDVQVSVLNCNSAAPEFDKTPQNTIKASGVVNQDGSTTVTVCTGQEAQFSFSAKSQAASNNVYIDANNATIPGSIVSVSNNGTSQPTATFIWTPHYGNIGDHILILTAKDSTCGVTKPLVLNSYKVVRIKVIASIFAGPDK